MSDRSSKSREQLLAPAQQAPATGATSAAQQTRPTKNVPEACNECRKRKIKCSGKRPCQHCLLRDIECLYTTKLGETIPQSLRRKIDELQRDIDEQQHYIDEQQRELDKLQSNIDELQSNNDNLQSNNDKLRLGEIELRNINHTLRYIQHNLQYRNNTLQQNNDKLRQCLDAHKELFDLLAELPNYMTEDILERFSGSVDMEMVLDIARYYMAKI